MAWLKEEQLLRNELYVTTDDTVWYGANLVSLDDNGKSAVVTAVAKDGMGESVHVFTVGNFRARFRLFRHHLSYVRGLSNSIVDCAEAIFKRLAKEYGTSSEIRLILPFSETELVDTLGRVLLEFHLPKESFRFELGEFDGLTAHRDVALVINRLRV